MAGWHLDTKLVILSPMPPGCGKHGRGQDGMNGLPEAWEPAPDAQAPSDLRGARLCPQSVVRVVFHDRRLQYTEQQQLEGWRWSRPGDRILDIGEWGELLSDLEALMDGEV